MQKLIFRHQFLRSKSILKKKTALYFTYPGIWKIFLSPPLPPNRIKIPQKGNHLFWGIFFLFGVGRIKKIFPIIIFKLRNLRPQQYTNCPIITNTPFEFESMKFQHGPDDFTSTFVVKIPINNILPAQIFTMNQDFLIFTSKDLSKPLKEIISIANDVKPSITKTDC